MRFQPNGRINVEYNGKLFELIAIDGQQVKDIMKFCRTRYPGQEEMRFAEDIVEVLSGMGRKVEKTVPLELRDVKTGKTTKVPNTKLTEANRQRVREIRRGAREAAPVSGGVVVGEAVVKEFHTALKERWSYHRAGGDIDAAVRAVREKLKGDLTENELLLELQKVIATATEVTCGDEDV